MKLIKQSPSVAKWTDRTTGYCLPTTCSLFEFSVINRRIGGRKFEPDDLNAVGDIRCFQGESKVKGEENMLFRGCSNKCRKITKSIPFVWRRRGESLKPTPTVHKQNPSACLRNWETADLHETHFLIRDEFIHGCPDGDEYREW